MITAATAAASPSSPPAGAQPHLVELQGRLDSGSSPRVEEEALAAIAGGTQLLLLDLGHLAYVSSAGLRTVLTLAKTLEAKQGRLALCSLQPEVASLFDLCGFRTMLPIYPDRQTAMVALTAFGQQASGRQRLDGQSTDGAA